MKFLFALTLLASLAFSTVAVANASPSSVEQHEAQSTVIVVNKSAKETIMGAGVIVFTDSSATIVTAKHLLVEGEVHVFLADGKPLNILTMTLVANHDLATIQVELPGPGRPLAVAQITDRFDRTNNLTVLGHPDKVVYVFTSATFLDADPDLPSTGYGQFTLRCAACTHGDSGGGVFDVDGRLVGIVSAATKGANGGPSGIVVAEPIAPALEAAGLTGRVSLAL